MLSNQRSSRKLIGFQQTLIVVSLTLGSVGLGAMFFQFDGLIQIEMGLNGGRITVDGRGRQTR